ncbi:MAG: sigma 54-interacting transcriptional regulator [Polyangiaceae bacterium]
MAERNAAPQEAPDGMASQRARADTLKLGPRARAGKRLALSVREGIGVRRFPLPASGEILIGRAPESAIQLDVPSISRRHARILGGEMPAIEDLGSTNGSWVNGAPLRPGSCVVLGEGDAVKLGDVLAVVEIVEHTAEVTTAEMPDDVVVLSARMRAVHDRVRLFARGSCPILLLGETGTGKEVYSSVIVRLSPRAGRPFLRLSCAALPADMIESELFGHERGAFTGAVTSKPGLLESADGGTVLLDEAGELSLQAQAKLLRALETGEILRLGAMRPRKVDVRLIAATNRDLARMVHEGSFRADLYYRLAGAEVVLPPLRERLEDLESLVAALLRMACASQGVPPKALSGAALRRLATHTWPGNVRELKSALERAVLVARGPVIDPGDITFVGGAALTAALATVPPSTGRSPNVVEIRPEASRRAPRRSPPKVEVHEAPPLPAMPPLPADLPNDAPAPPLGAPAHPDDFYDARRARERAAMVAALERHGGNQTRASTDLGMPRRTFVKRLTEYGIRAPRKPDPNGEIR